MKRLANRAPAAPAPASTPAPAPPAPRKGKLARELLHASLPLRVLISANGYYIGTADEEGPCSRESAEYFPDQDQAEAALAAGEWTQRLAP